MCGGPAGGGANTTAGARCKVQQVRDWAGLAIIFIGFFISGIGTSFFYSFGIPYIDDNVSKRNSPMALSFVLAGRTLGPALGYLLGAATLRLYVVPGLQVDPRIKLYLLIIYTITTLHCPLLTSGQSERGRGWVAGRLVAGLHRDRAGDARPRPAPSTLPGEAPHTGSTP